MNIVDRIISPNLWDEVWEVGGISKTTGMNSTDLTRIRSSHYIKIQPNTNYHISRIVGLYQFRADYSFISWSDTNTFTSSSDAEYVRIVIYNTTIYQYNTCLNISNPSINGKYFPYVMYKRYDMVDLIHPNNSIKRLKIGG